MRSGMREESGCSCCARMRECRGRRMRWSGLTHERLSHRGGRRGRRLFLDDDRALQHQRGDRADGCELRREQRADHADRQRNVDEHAAVLVLDDDTADVALANDLLDLRQQRVAAELELFGTGSGLGHGRLLVFWLKAAKALSTTPSKGVAFAGYPITSFKLTWPVHDIAN